MFNVDIAFFYRQATGTKACVTAADLIDSDGNIVVSSVMLHFAAILKYILCLSAEFLWMFSIWTHSCLHFFVDWQLAPARLYSDLTVDADWHRLNILIGSRHTSLETQTEIWNWLRQQPHCTQLVHCLQTVHCLLLLLKPQRWLNRWGLSSLSWWHHAVACTKNATYEISKQLPNENSLDIQMQTPTYYLLQLSANAHLVRIWPEYGHWRYVRFFIITSKVSTSWLSV